MPNLATKTNCTGCMACENRCPHNAIKIVNGEDGHKYIEVIQEKCVECKLCEKTCPIVNGKVYGNNDLSSEFCGGWSRVENLRDSGATAGIFGVIAQKIITEGGWIAGAVMDKLNCKYIITNSLENLPILQGSKYTYSNPRGIYEKIVNKLREGDMVLFCGLPCHVGALLSYVPASLSRNLYTIDLICGGVPSPILIRRFKEEHPEMRRILRFRDKQEEGWKPSGYRYNLTYQDESGQIVRQQKNNRNLITDGFACELTDRYSCYSCQFSFTSRKSDITIGDLWGDGDFIDQHRRGVSALIVHSEKGKKLLAGADIEYKIISPVKILSKNRRIFYGKSIKRFLPERRMIGWMFKHLSYNSLLKVYCSDLRNLSILSIAIIPYRMLTFKLCNIISKYYSDKVMKKMGL